MEPACGCGSFLPWLCSVSTPAFSVPRPVLPLGFHYFKVKALWVSWLSKMACYLVSTLSRQKTKGDVPVARGRSDPVAVDGCPVMYLHLALFNLCYSLSTTLSSLCSFHHANNSKIFKTKFTL